MPSENPPVSVCARSPKRRLIVLSAAIFGAAAIGWAMLRPPSTDDERWAERLRVGRSELRLESRRPEPGLVADERMTLSIESASGRLERSAYAIAPPDAGFGGELVHERLAELRSSAWAGAAPVLKRFVVPGPVGRSFIAFIEVELAATTTPSVLTVIPVIDGVVSVGAADTLQNAYVEGTGNELRIWQSDFGESDVVVPGHGYLGRVCLQLEGTAWIPDLGAMRRPPPSTTEFSELVRTLRASWHGCGNPECIGSAADLAQAIADLVFSGNAKSGVELLKAVLGDRPEDETAFRRLFARELTSHVAHMEAVRALNGGELWGLTEVP